MNDSLAPRRLPLLIALLPLPVLAQNAADPAPQQLPTVEVQAARVQGIDPFALPASQDTVWVGDDRSGPGVQVSEALAG
ncbi:MAG TPA: TonB-dependent receptor, partial [Stenotrophomonas sp.]|nr:TonB-dependent receptor [Stenotrophomonas sp.]